MLSASLMILFLFSFIQVIWFSVCTFHLQKSHKLFHPNLIILFHHDCVPDIFPIWTYLHNYLWSCCLNYIQLVHCVWYWQPDQAIWLWWIHMGVCGSLLGYSEPFPRIVKSFERAVKLRYTHGHFKKFDRFLKSIWCGILKSLKSTLKNIHRFLQDVWHVNGQMLNSWIRWYLL